MVHYENFGGCIASGVDSCRLGVILRQDISVERIYSNDSATLREPVGIFMAIRLRTTPDRGQLICQMYR